MRTILVTLILCIAATSASAKPAAVRSAAAVAATAKTELAKAKANAKLANHRLKLAKAHVAAAKAAKRLQREQWIADCIVERTGPTDGITAEEAVELCTVEAPDATDN